MIDVEGEAGLSLCCGMGSVRYNTYLGLVLNLSSAWPSASRSRMFEPGDFMVAIDLGCFQVTQSHYLGRLVLLDYLSRVLCKQNLSCTNICTGQLARVLLNLSGTIVQKHYLRSTSPLRNFGRKQGYPIDDHSSQLFDKTRIRPHRRLLGQMTTALAIP